MATARAMLERRRSSRVHIRIPVKVLSSEIDGEPRDASAEAISVSRTGALLRLPFLPELGSRIEVLHGLSHEVREFRVISVRDARSTGRSSWASRSCIPLGISGAFRFPTNAVSGSKILRPDSVFVPVRLDTLCPVVVL